jgi:phage tail tape-measure protein
MADITARAVLVDKMTPKMKKISGESSKMAKNVNKSSKSMASSIKSLDGKSMALKTTFTALAGAGVVLFARSILKAGSEMEKLETQFKVLLKDTDSAKARMQELSKFAQTTPFQLTQVANASRVLQTLGGNLLSTGDGLRMVGDAAAISGESFENLATHVGRAYSGLQSNRPIGESLARLQELGLVSGATRNKIEDLTKAAKGKEAWKILEKELAKTKGGMKELSSTMGGLSSTLKDQFQGALRQLGSGGFFDAIKGGLKNVVQWFNILLDGGFFARIGAGFDYISSGMTAFSLTAIAGWQRIGEVASGILYKIVEGINLFMKDLPPSLVPDSWASSVQTASDNLKGAFESVQDSADNTSLASIQAWDDVANAYNRMVNGISTPKYKEKTQEVTTATTKMVDDSKEKLQELLDFERESAVTRAEFLASQHAVVCED